MGERYQRLGLWVLLAATVAGGFALYAANLWFGDLNQDEGWYLYTARQVLAGRMPYRDFHYSQAPLTLWTYTALQWAWPAAGVAEGRLFTAGLGFASACLAAWLCLRLSAPAWRWHAGVTALLLILLNVYQSYFTTVIKTYAVAGLLTTAGVVALSFLRTRPRTAAALGGILMACSAGTRITLGLTLAVAGLYLLIQYRRYGLAWLVFGLAGGATLAALYGPFLVLAPEGFLFGMSVHGGRSAGGLLPALLYKAGFASRVVRAYYLTFLAGGLAVAGAWYLRGRSAGGRRPEPEPEGRCPAHFGAFILALLAVVSLVHLAAPFPYDDYQVPLYPLFAALVAWALWRVAGPALDARGALGAAALLFVAAAGAAASSPLNQEWFIRGRDRIWWLRKDRPQLAQLREVAQWIRAQASGPGARLLTQDTYLAVEAGLAVPDGLEMGPFSYFPALPDDQAQRGRVFNRGGLERLLATTDAELAAFSGYGLAIQMPGVDPVPAADREAFYARVRQRYELVREVPDFGQGFTTLTIWKRRPE